MPRGRPSIDREKVKETVKETIDQIVEESLAEAEGGTQPGQILDMNKPTSRKVPWKRSDMEKVYGRSTFTPEETLPVTVNGVTFQLLADQPFSGPACVEGVYQEYRQAKRRTPTRLMTSHGVVNVLPGAGSLGEEAEG